MFDKEKRTLPSTFRIHPGHATDVTEHILDIARKCPIYFTNFLNFEHDRTLFWTPRGRNRKFFLKKKNDLHKRIRFENLGFGRSRRPKESCHMMRTPPRELT